MNTLKFISIIRLLSIQVQQVACSYGNPTCVSSAQDEFNGWRNDTVEYVYHI